VRILGATDAQLRKRVEAFQEALEATVLEKDAALRDRVLGSDGKVTGE
jgi:5-(carboxyamino)imidazole ribonucleotide mutase